MTMAAPTSTPALSRGHALPHRGRHLPRGLESVLARPMPDFELIAVDDGSTDETWNILCAFAARDARIRPCAAAQGVALAGNAAAGGRPCAPHRPHGCRRFLPAAQAGRANALFEAGHSAGPGVRPGALRRRKGASAWAYALNVGLAETPF